MSTASPVPDPAPLPDDPIVVLSPLPEPPKEAPPNLYIAVRMPRVVCIVQRDLITTAYRSDGPMRTDHTGLGYDWPVGTKVLVDQSLFDQINDRQANTLLAVETLPEDQWPVRKMRRLRGQEGDETTY